MVSDRYALEGIQQYKQQKEELSPQTKLAVALLNELIAMAQEGVAQGDDGSQVVLEYLQTISKAFGAQRLVLNTVNGVINVLRRANHDLAEEFEILKAAIEAGDRSHPLVKLFAEAIEFQKGDYGDELIEQEIKATAERWKCSRGQAWRLVLLIRGHAIPDETEKQWLSIMRQVLVDES